MPSLNVFNNDVAQASLAPPASVPERYAELWWYSGNIVNMSATASAGAANSMLQKGSTTAGSTGSASAKLYTLNVSWSASTKYALEIAMDVGASATGYAALWDFTSNSVVSGSMVSTTSAAPTLAVVRSGQFTLTPGHQYGVSVYNSIGSGYSANVTDASLIIFP